jgi:hypothetical protein
MRLGTRFRVAAGALAAAATLGVSAEARAASSTFPTGFVDQASMQGGERDLWLDRAKAVGASRVRIALSWGSVAPTAPPAADAGSAGWPGYRFTLLDAQVRRAAAKGVNTLITAYDAPAWASSTGRPNAIRAAAWKPDPAAFGAFMRAVAQRYSGSFPDPEKPGMTLPRVDQFQLWNEPNLNIYLAPQNENGRPFAAIRFRELVNAGYAGVKSVQPAATVVGAGLAPYGDPGANPSRTRPLAFLRDMLCLDSSLNKSCGDTTTVDALSIHPYTTNKPSQRAFDRDDVTVPDIPKMQRVIDAARGAGTVGPTRPPVWVTELHWETSPDPKGIPIATRARYISEAFWRLWRADVPMVYWYLLRDEEYKPGQRAFDSYQTGIFYRSGRRKSDSRAFRFPLLVTGRSASRLNVWFRTPTKGTTTIQLRRGGVWVTVLKKRKLRANAVAKVQVPRASVSGVRAFAGRAKSYVWDVE